MKYTLDSVYHVERILERKFKDHKVIREVALLPLNDAKFLTKEDKRYYFGVITVGDGVNCHIQNDGLEVIKVIQNNQVIEVFDSLVFKNDLDEVVAGKGQFRGFEIEIN